MGAFCIKCFISLVTYDYHSTSASPCTLVGQILQFSHLPVTTVDNKRFDYK
jgi:hypothetical protein